VFEGAVAGGAMVTPEAAVLLGWATELDIAIPSPTGDTAGGSGEQVGAPGRATASASPDDATRLLAVKGYAGPEAVAAALGCDGATSAALLDGLVADGLAEAAAGSFRLTAAGKEAGRRLLDEDSAAWGIDRAVEALDAFLVLDRVMKETVTAWQVRDTGGVLAANDHADPAYDAEVLSRLAALHEDAGAWLAGLAGAPPRMARYAERLAAAAERAIAGDGRYVASPRVDSFHGVWFELHEDLILLAGRSRADEAAAGRA
jgi:pyruvate, orthophosphate dikinase